MIITLKIEHQQTFFLGNMLQSPELFNGMPTMVIAITKKKWHSRSALIPLHRLLWFTSDNGCHSIFFSLRLNSFLFFLLGFSFLIRQYICAPSSGHLKPTQVADAIQSTHKLALEKRRRTNPIGGRTAEEEDRRRALKND
jgi:hypothetical protein